MRRLARVDANQPAIVATLRKCGFAVAHCHTVGSGFPDLVIARRGWTALIEIKDGSKPPSARKLTPDEAEFHAKWPGEIFIIENENDVLKLNERFINEAMQMAKLYDISVTTGTYEINGEKKYRSVRVGSIWEGKNGPYLRIDRTFNPAGVPVNDPAVDSIICNMWAPKDGQQSAPQPQQAKNFNQQPAQEPASGGAGFDDDIPF